MNDQVHFGDLLIFDQFLMLSLMNITFNQFRIPNVRLYNKSLNLFVHSAEVSL